MDCKRKLMIPIFNLKLLVIVWCAVIVTAAVSGTCLSAYTVDKLEEQGFEKVFSDIQVIAENIHSYVRDIENFSIHMITSETVQKMLKGLDEAEGVEYFKTLRELRKQLKYYVALRSSAIVDMYIVKGEQEIIGDIGKNNKTEEEWYQAYLKKKLSRGFSTVIEPESNLHGEYSVKNFHYIIDILDINESNNILGKLVLVLDYDFFISTTMFETGQYASVLLINQDDQLMAFTQDGNEEAENAAELCRKILKEDSGWEKNGHGYFIVQPVQEQGWKVYGILNKEEISRDLNPVRKVLGILIAGCLVISILIFTPVIYFTTRPMKEIIRGMQEVSAGNLKTSITIRTRDELTVMADTFNHMVMDIQRFLQESLEREKQENELRMKLLMAQINPHFICNTLNVIIYQAQKIKAQNIIDVTRAFINIIQVTINLDYLANATILEEKKYIESYMMISRYRYDNVVDIKWEVAEEVMGCKINRMLLYPIVENSMMHGIFPTGRKGKIAISIKREGDWIYICVEDNGQGIEAERLEEIREKIVNKRLEGRSSIGLQNVNLRLMLIYGEECRMKIESKAGGGCRTLFKIPYDRENL